MAVSYLHVELKASRHLNQLRCHLLELPAELRDQIWIHAVTEWAPAPPNDGDESNLLQTHPIRQDFLNRPLPPAITRTNRQIRSETLHLYYKHNIFEFWRPSALPGRLVLSTLGRYLTSLGSRRDWLREVVLLYKHESELDYDLEQTLCEQGLGLSDECLLRNELQLSEFEMHYEELGLPRSFGKKRR